MTIDWSKEVETTEDPPRPVRVLFDKDGVPKMAQIFPPDEDTINIPIMNDSGLLAARVGNADCLRNVAPPKPEPVLREAWVVWDSDGYETVWCVEKDASDRARHFRGTYARAAVMSDGSPVPGEGHTNCWANYNLMLTDRDAWKAKAEALQTEVLEQARLLGMSAEREHALLGKISRLEADLAAAWAALKQCREAFEFTRQYVGYDVLPAIEGWSWYDADKAAEAAIAAARAEGGE